MTKLKTFFKFLYLTFFPIIILVSFLLLLVTSFFLNQYWQIIFWVNLITVVIFILLVFVYLKVFQDLKIWSKIVFTMTVILVFSLNLFIFLPYNTNQKSSQQSDISYWETEINYLNQENISRSVKTKIAYKFYAANKDIKKKESSLVFLHGGPGAFAVNLQVANDFYKQFTKLGYDVYLYDQSGSGSSARLDDIADYNYKYLVAELEKIREIIKSEKLVIVGESWGGGLGSSYNSYYPERVEKIVFINPVEIETPKIGEYQFDVSKTNAPANLDDLIKNEITSRPRALISVLWLQNNFNSGGSKALLPDSDADYIADRMFSIQAPDAVCKGVDISPEVLNLKGNGFWVQIATNNSLAKRTDEPISKLKNINTPALLISSECDFIPEFVNDQYKEAYGKLETKYIEKAGHITYFQKFDETTKLVENFIK